MKIFILSDSSSIHTKKWVNSLAQKGVEVCLFSIGKCDENEFYIHSNIKLVECDSNQSALSEGAIPKIALLKYLPKLRKLIREFKPDIVHAHYASSYGLLGALSGFRPFVLSVWGSDVFDFPNISFIHEIILKFNLYRANRILSTSHIMAIETKKYTNKRIDVTPFGIDLKRFKNFKVDSIFPSETIVIGTVKALSPKYGIDYLIKAFEIVKRKYPYLPLKLMIVGEGADKLKLIKICEDLGILGDVVFTGKVDNNLVPKYLNMMEVYVALSTLDSESFGVAIVEAGACEKPVVVSNVGGLPEVVEADKTGFVVESKNSDAAAHAIERLVLDQKLRKAMGKAGRKRVQQFYDWNQNVDLMISIYNDILN